MNGPKPVWILATKRLRWSRPRLAAAMSLASLADAQDGGTGEIAALTYCGADAGAGGGGGGDAGGAGVVAGATVAGPAMTLTVLSPGLYSGADCTSARLRSSFSGVFESGA